MIFTPNPPHVPFPSPGVTMTVAFDFNPYALPRMRSVAPKITQLAGSVGQFYYQIEYLLPNCTRIGDVLEFYLVDVSNPFPVRILTVVLDDYSVFLTLRRKQGVLIKAELKQSDLTSAGITPATFDFECVQYGGSIPTPPSPFPQVTVTPTRTVAVSFLNTYVIT